MNASIPFLGCISFVLVLVGVVLLIIGAAKRNAKGNRSASGKSFSGVKEEFDRLKAQFDAHTLSEAQFKARLKELMVQDEQGRWWMIGYETGLWYVHDGERWKLELPAVNSESSPQGVEAQKKAANKASPMRLFGLIMLIAGAIWACYDSVVVFSYFMSNYSF